MSVITKLLFSVSEKGNAMAQLWVDDADTTKTSDCIYIAIKSQVAYLLFLGVGSQVSLKKSRQYTNIEVPDMFTNLFDGYKVSTDNTIKMVGTMLNNAFDNMFKSLEFIKNGEVVRISREEANNKCSEYMQGYIELFNTALDELSKSNIGGLKTIASTLTKETSKPSEIKEANSVVMSYALMLNREAIAKNNFLIEAPLGIEKEETK